MNNAARTRRAHHNSHTLHSDIAKIRHAFADTATNVGDRAGELLAQSMENVKETSTMVKDNVADYTAEKPFKSLGIALLTGVVIGFLIRR